MRFSRPASAAALPHVVAGVGLTFVALLTLVDRGATRAYATPWIWLFWFAHLAPFAGLMLRTLGTGPEFALPERRWQMVAAGIAAVTLVSALTSPYRGSAVLGALTPLAGIAAFFLVHDWLAQDPQQNARRLLRAVGWFAVAVTLFSLLMWLADLLPAQRPIARWLDHRNDHPLGRANYTAGLAVLCVPWLGALAWQTVGRARLGWSGATLLALTMLVSSGSRGGWLGFVALGVTALLHARLGWKRTTIWFVSLAVIVGGLVLLHPRIRTLTLQPRVVTENLGSTAQRTTLLTAGVHMGADRPLFGWGPGTTPHVFPRYRGQLDGSADNVPQLHSTPVQLWADLGLAGVLGLLAVGGLFIREAARDLRPTGSARTGDTTNLRSPAIIALTGYGVLALTDYQLDVPVFTLAIATLLAAIAQPAANKPDRRMGRWWGLTAALVLAVTGVFGERDPAPLLNNRALTFAQDPAQSDAAIALLRESLALNPDQEIAHFNLGWLLLARAPQEAESHFLAAARLVPDRRGVYLGLALARINQHRRDREPAITRALALEALNDPLFLTSPWWRESTLAALRPAALAQLRAMAGAVSTQLASQNDLRSREATYVIALTDWLEGTGPLSAALAHSHTAERVSYFAARPSRPDFAAAAVRTDHRERRDYPILMRNLDLAPPRDVYEIRENVLAADSLGFLFPPRGWLPGPLLLGLLDARQTPSS